MSAFVGAITRSGVQAGVKKRRCTGMPLAPVITLANYRMDLRRAGEYAGVEPRDIIAAVARGELPASDGHRDRPGVWLVRMRDVDAWSAANQRAAG